MRERAVLRDMCSYLAENIIRPADDFEILASERVIIQGNQPGGGKYPVERQPINLR